MKKFFSEFKTFATRGNLLDFAIGVIIGSAFAAVTTSFIGDMFMPVLSIVLGGVDFQTWSIKLPNLFNSGNPPVMYPGKFINAIVNFIIIAFILFVVVKIVNKAKNKPAEAAPPPAPPEPTKEELLLSEIRDILRDK